MKSMRHIVAIGALITVAVFCFTETASATAYYVRTDGNDANAGTANTPEGAWQTIQQAATTMIAGDTVYVQPGTYYEDVVPANAGGAGNRITYKAVGRVIIDGQDSGDEAFNINGKDYITIDGFRMTNYPDGGGFHATVRIIDGDNIIVRNCIIHDTGRDALNFQSAGDTSDNILVENCLMYNLDDDGIAPYGLGNHTFKNNVIYNCGGNGVEGPDRATNVWENNIIWDNITDTVTATWNYNDYSGGVLPGTGNISANPLFVSPGSGDFHLNHIAAGQGSNSPCIDAGSGPAVNLGYHDKSTRTDNIKDEGIVDMGYHYRTVSSVVVRGGVTVKGGVRIKR